MKVELFLKKINQEMLNFLKAPARGCDFYVQWTKECCILDFCVVGDKGELTNLSRKGFMLRKEDDGGMIWDTRTGAVYKMDEEAYHTLLELENGVSKREAAKRVGVSIKSINNLITILKRI